MPTQRLSDYEKDDLTGEYLSMLGRAGYNQPFPMEFKSQVWDMGIDLLPKRIRKAYVLLRDEAPLLTSVSKYRTQFIIRGATHEYKFSILENAPMENLVIYKSYPRYDEILAWVQWKVKISIQIHDASNTIKRAIQCCTSAGQVKRILPPETLRIMPATMLESLGEAERISRVPAGFKVTTEEMEHFVNMLTLGSISPERRKGVFCDINNVEELPDCE